ncbi:MAG: hypothetical protein ACYDC2_09450, partial [Solirubrobacteraceae bacterium]
ERIVAQVLQENSGRWQSASPRDVARVQEIARAVMSRLLHEPTLRLRSLDGDRASPGATHGGGEASGHASLELVRELFGLREEEPAQPAGSEESPVAGHQPTPGASELAEVHDLHLPRRARRHREG